MTIRRSVTGRASPARSRFAHEEPDAATSSGGRRARLDELRARGARRRPPARRRRQRRHAVARHDRDERGGLRAAARAAAPRPRAPRRRGRGRPCSSEPHGTRTVTLIRRGHASLRGEVPPLRPGRTGRSSGRPSAPVGGTRGATPRPARGVGVEADDESIRGPRCSKGKDGPAVARADVDGHPLDGEPTSSMDLPDIHLVDAAT